MDSKKGFTLTELLVALAVFGIILLIAIPTYIGINKTVKERMLEEKIKVIEESSILLGENIKDTILSSTNKYKEEFPCKSINISYLVPNYLDKDTDSECLNENEEEIGCIVDPSNKDNYLDNKEVIIYYKNKRIYAVVDINDELVCEVGKNNAELKITTFYLGNGNPEYTTTKDVTAYLSWDNPNVKFYCVTNIEGSNNCEWKVSRGTIATPNHTLTDGDDEKIVYAYLMDNSGNISPGVSDTIILNTVVPTENSVIINEGATHVNNPNVTLTLSSNGATEMCISNTISCTNWEEYKTSKSWTLSSGDGTKTVYAWFRNEYGNISEYVYDTIILNTSSPTNNSIKINNGATHTNKTGVTLTLSSTGATQMCISNTTSCTNWEEYKTSKSWTLSSGDGSKTVYVWYKNDIGNISDYVSAEIILDTIAPTNNSVKINNDATHTNKTGVTLTLSSTGASKMCISNTTSCTNWEEYKTSKNWTITSTDGTKTVYVWYEDAAGNKTEKVNDSIILDTVPPVVTAEVRNNGTADSKIYFSTAENIGSFCLNSSGVISNMNNCITEDGGDFIIQANTTYTNRSGALRLSGTYYVHAEDLAGNIGISEPIVVNKIQSFGEYLLENPPTGLNATSSYNGLYRFTGTSANNYVSLNGVLYRIIGITSTWSFTDEEYQKNPALGEAMDPNLNKYQVKLIKATSIGTHNWHSSATSNTTWLNASIYSYLQNNIPSGWSSKIQTLQWNIGDTGNNYSTGSGVYYRETTMKSSDVFKIGLMYLSDYIYAYKANGQVNCNTTACNSWLTPSSSEWTMIRYGYDSSSLGYMSWIIDSGGKAYISEVNNSYSVRPVFYLIYGVSRVSGTGTSSNPFVVS